MLSLRSEGMRASFGGYIGRRETVLFSIRLGGVEEVEEGRRMGSPVISIM